MQLISQDRVSLSLTMRMSRTLQLVLLAIALLSLVIVHALVAHPGWLPAAGIRNGLIVLGSISAAGNALFLALTLLQSDTRRIVFDCHSRMIVFTIKRIFGKSRSRQLRFEDVERFERIDHNRSKERSPYDVRVVPVTGAPFDFGAFDSPAQADEFVDEIRCLTRRSCAT